MIEVGLDVAGSDWSPSEFLSVDIAEWTRESLARAVAFRADLRFFVVGNMVEQQVEAVEYSGVG